MKSDIQHSLESLASNVESSVKFETVWSQYKREEKTSKRSLNQYLRRGFASVVIGALGVTGAGVGLAVFSPSVALAMDKTPIVNQVYDWFGDPGLNQAGVFTDKVHISSTDRGITFTVTDVYDDQGRVALEYQVTSSNGSLTQTAYAPNMSFYMNGQPLKMTSGGAAGSVSNQRWRGVSEIYPAATNQSLPKQFDLQVVIHQIGNTHGYWEAQVPVSGKSTQQDTKTFTPGLTKSDGGITLGVDQVTVTPATIMVDYHYTIQRGANVHVYLNASSNNKFLGSTIGGPTHTTYDGGKETVYGFSLFDKPTKFDGSIQLVPENDPMPAPGATTSPSIELPNLDVTVPLNQ